MDVEAIAEVVLLSGGEQSHASSPQSYGFILSFGSESFPVIPSGAGELKQNIPERVRLRFLVDDARHHLILGREFNFFDNGRKGKGRIVEFSGTV